MKPIYAKYTKAGRKQCQQKTGRKQLWACIAAGDHVSARGHPPLDLEDWIFVMGALEAKSALTRVQSPAQRTMVAAPQAVGAQALGA